MPEPASQPEDLPAPSAEAILYRVAIEAFIEGLPRAEAERFLRTMAEALASEESLSHISLIRPPPEQAEVDKARRRAIALFRRYLPVFLARLDEGG